MEYPANKKDYGYYGPGSATWRIGSETVVLLGGARAVLMQIAHPMIAMGVYAHSSYMSDPFGRTERTFTLGQYLTFGSTVRTRRAAQTINRLHRHVHGTLPLDVGAYSSGSRYDARNPELLLWVHATLVDTVLLTYRLFIGPLSYEEQDRYYQESKRVAHLLGLQPRDMPRTVNDLKQYVDDMVHSNRLAATPQARRIAQQVLFPPLPPVFRPLIHLNFQLTCALLPQPLRDIYDMEWSDIRQRAFDVSTWGMRTVIPHLPMSMRVLPVTRRIIERTMSQSA
ncbi:MAG TPA: oxygenase MpaB family protein [Ktedonobacteraceae bacterium]|nr:oxygenase MpaB family protein [Ktedonobacteraceae bacterium]